MGVVPQPGALRMIAPIAPSRTLLTEVDVGNPAALRVVRTFSVEADYVSARLVGGTVRIVTSSQIPRQLQFENPAGTDPQAVAAATAHNRAVVASSRVKSWLPTYVVENRRSGATHTRSLVQCRAVQHPPTFSGLGLATVLTIDLDKGLDPVDSDSVLSDGRIVYASPSRLYVATERWSDRPLPAQPNVVPEGVRTALHAFDISSPSQTVYRASGEVPGFLLNQWSLSEFRGVLRVASTESPPWFDPVRVPRARASSRPSTSGPASSASSGASVASGTASGFTRFGSRATPGTSSRSGRSIRSTRSISPIRPIPPCSAS